MLSRTTLTRTVLAGSSLLTGILALYAQDVPVFRAEVGLVQIEVRVADDDSEPVADLDRADFVLEEDGQEQEIEIFQFVGRHPDVAGPATSPLAPGPPQVGPRREAEPNYTWLYIAPEVSQPHEFARASGPLRSFIEDRLPAGFMVSLAGLPFADKKELLLASLDRMVGEPHGRGEDRSGLVDPVLDLEDELYFEREVALALQRQTGIIASSVGLSRDPPSTGRVDDISSLVSVERIDRQILFFGRLALLRYLDLIERMAAFPGKKMILLYRSGLRVEPAHSDLLDQIAATALRHRVSFFTLDSRGLDASVPVEDRRVSFAWESTGRSRRIPTVGIPTASEQAVNGLVTLAKITDGTAIVDANDATSILQDVLDESSNYYVLGYRPRDPTEEGRFRKLKVSVNRPGIKLRAPRGYSERKPFDRQSSSERAASMYRALLSEAPADFPVRTSFGFFAAPEGRTAMVFSTGVRPRALAAKKGKKSELEATVLVRVRDRVFDSMPVILEEELRPTVTREFLEQAGADPTVFLAYNGRVDLPPGRYSLKVLFRDDRSGRMGTFEQTFEVPNLTGSSVPSSFLLTRQAQPSASPSPESGGEEPPPNDLLGAGDLRLTPEPARLVRPGHVVYCVYHLYNATEGDFLAADRGMQMGLLRDGEWMASADVSAGGEAFPDRESRTIRFVGWVDTQRLPPGKYTLLAVLPNYETREVPDLSGDFEVLSP
jgi:VWFA-related protein